VAEELCHNPLESRHEHIPAGRDQEKWVIFILPCIPIKPFKHDENYQNHFEK
jgi:hypothetical protein